MIGGLTPAEVAETDQNIMHARALIADLVAEVPRVASFPLDGRGELIHMVGMIEHVNGENGRIAVHALAVELILCLAEARGGHR